MIQELLKLVKENPDLPIVPMVDCDVVPEDYGRWLASFGNSYVSEYTLFNERYYEDDREGFKEAYYDYYADELCEKFNYHPEWNFVEKFKTLSAEEIEANNKAEAELDKYLDKVAEDAFKKAIIVYIDLPD